MKINGKIEIDENYKLENLMPACASYSISSNISLSKSGTFGGTQVPFDTQSYSYGNIFSLTTGKIYCSRNAIIQVDYTLSNATQSHYVLLGRNGSYVYIGGCSPANGIAGSTLAGSFQFEINANEYITLQLGSPGTYSNKTIFSGSRLSVSVVRYLNWVDLWVSSKRYYENKWKCKNRW